MSQKYGFREYISAGDSESLEKNIKKYIFSEYWSDECESVVENFEK